MDQLLEPNAGMVELCFIPADAAECSDLDTRLKPTLFIGRDTGETFTIGAALLTFKPLQWFRDFEPRPPATDLVKDTACIPLPTAIRTIGIMTASPAMLS